MREKINRKKRKYKLRTPTRFLKKHKKIIKYTAQILTIVLILTSIFLYMIIPKLKYFSEQDLFSKYHNLTSEQKKLLMNPYDYSLMTEEEIKEGDKYKRIAGESFETYKKRYQENLIKIMEKSNGSTTMVPLEIIEMFYINEPPINFVKYYNVPLVEIRNLGFEDEFNDWTAYGDIPQRVESGCLHGSCLEIKTSDTFKTMQMRSKSVKIKDDGRFYWTLIFVKCIECENNAVFVGLDSFKQDENKINPRGYTRITQYIQPHEGFVPYILLAPVRESYQNNMAISIAVNSDGAGISDYVHVLIDMPTEEEMELLSPEGKKLFEYYNNKEELTREELIEYYTNHIDSQENYSATFFV